VPHFISVIHLNLVTLKAAAKDDILFSKLAFLPLPTRNLLSEDSKIFSEISIIKFRLGAPRRRRRRKQVLMNGNFEHQSWNFLTTKLLSEDITPRKWSPHEFPNQFLGQARPKTRNITKMEPLGRRGVTPWGWHGIANISNVIDPFANTLSLTCSIPEQMLKCLLLLLRSFLLFPILVHTKMHQGQVIEIAWSS
jgi:hypothetical protein